MIHFSSISRIDKSLRPYQQEAKEKIFRDWDEYRDILFQMPTGTGKTRLFSSIISDIKAWSTLLAIDCRILIIAHRIELIDQISENLEKYSIQHGIIAGGRPRNLRRLVQIASIQTITHHANLDVISDLNVQFIIIDEAHHSMANSYKRLWSFFPDAKKLGVTATPWRMNGIGFTSLYEDLVLSKPIKDFISEGWLSKFFYYSVMDESIENKRINSITEYDIEGDYKVSALEREMDTLQIRARLLDSYLRFAKGKKGIIYSISKKHSEHICEEYKVAGFRVVKIDSNTPRDERNMLVQRFRKGLIDIIVNVDIFSEGFDCPDIEFIQLARPTRSLVKYLQQVGRGLRPTKGKTNCVILDNVGACARFGLPDQVRPWKEYFEGESEPSTNNEASSRVLSLREGSTRDLSEGDADMVLVQGVEAQEAIGEKTPCEQWSESDDFLIFTLYKDKNCPISLIACVFGKEEEEIKRHLQELGLI